MELATFYDHVKDIARQERVSMTEALQRVRSLGITHVEVSQNNALGQEDVLGHELSYAGLGISSMPAYFDFGRDGDIEKQSGPTLEAARFLGVKKLLVIPGFWGEGDSPQERERQRERMAGGVNRLAELAGGYGVSLVMEEYDSPLAPFSNTEGVRYFLDRCPGLGCCFDTGNFRVVAEDELAAYEGFKNRIGHVHLKDRGYTPAWGTHTTAAADGQTLYPVPVGKGELRMGELLARLGRDGYEGVCTIEHYGVENMWTALQASVEWLRAQPAFAEPTP